jgi:8-oxo-dGTP diphosphatase
MPPPVTPPIAVDALIIQDGSIVLIKRKNPPFQNCWALPGGFVEIGETVENSCIREAKEETNLDIEITRLIGIFSDPKRDPRGHIVSAAFLCSVKSGTLKGKDDAIEAGWYWLDILPPLAFDHSQIIDNARPYTQSCRSGQSDQP